MHESSVERFKRERDRLNEIVMKYAGMSIKRFYSLDSRVYREGALPKKTKELLGLVASFVLRCDDCVKYHIIRSHEEGVGDDELEEALGIGLVVGGSITIPHLRRALEVWDELKKTGQPAEAGVEVTEKKRLFRSLLDQVRDIANSQSESDEKLKAICALLADRVDHYNWVGFYLVDESGENLRLGPFVGAPTEHMKIPFGKGICGQAAEQKETFVVQDVSRETNYLSCSVDVKSEIVVPIMKGAEVVGELDIDSHALSPFTEEDRDFLEGVCQLVAQLF